MTPQAREPGIVAAAAEGVVSSIAALASVVFPPEARWQAVSAVGLVQPALAAESSPVLPVKGERAQGPPSFSPPCAASLVIPAEQNRREALARLNSVLRSSPWPKQWWSTLWHFRRPEGQDPVTLRLPASVGTSFFVVNGLLSEGCVYLAMGGTEKWSGRGSFLLIPHRPKLECTLKGQFSC